MIDFYSLGKRGCCTSVLCPLPRSTGYSRWQSFPFQITCANPESKKSQHKVSKVAGDNPSFDFYSECIMNLSWSTLCIDTILTMSLQWWYSYLLFLYTVVMIAVIVIVRRPLRVQISDKAAHYLHIARICNLENQPSSDTPKSQNIPRQSWYSKHSESTNLHQGHIVIQITTKI